MLEESSIDMYFLSRRPVPAVEEEREQAEFENDIKLLRERQRREIKFILKHDFIDVFFCLQVNSIV